MIVTELLADLDDGDKNMDNDWSLLLIQGVWPIKIIQQNNSGSPGSSVKDNGARLTVGSATKLA